jgi:hypothetical protein
VDGDVRATRFGDGVSITVSSSYVGTGTGVGDVGRSIVSVGVGTDRALAEAVAGDGVEGVADGAVPAGVDGAGVPGRDAP